MKTQSRIKSVLTQPEAIERVKNILNASGDINRTELANQICSQFGFFNPRGEKQHSGCMKVLRALEKAGYFNLPKSNYSLKKTSPKLLKEPVPEIQGIPNEVGKISELNLVLVESKEQMQLWNELMVKDHPREVKLFVGCQLHYLIAFEYGWLGGFGFSSSSLHLAARDKWIGWDWNERQAKLLYVVNLNRF